MPEENELFAFVQRPDEAFAWNILDVSQQAEVTIAKLQLASQIWQGIPWTHEIQLFIPTEPRQRDIVALYIETPSATGQTELGMLLAQATGVACAFLSDIPNQPLFDDLVEDALIAYTFIEYLETGDATWPLLFPMTKSVVRAMDAIQAFALQEGAQTPERFIVSGASKRGWTTWLTAAVDTRVCAIVPMVFDNLNIAAQMPHQLEVFEGYSDQISDYTERNLPQHMQTPAGQQLALMVDPYTYRDRLALPKLIINGSNDPYWATDAINLYWDDLPGTKYLLDIPNVGHSLQDHDRLFSTFITFVTSVADLAPLPTLDWAFSPERDFVMLTIRSNTHGTTARCWIAYATGRDFRSAPWTSSEMTAIAHATAEYDLLVTRITRPESGYMAVYGEVGFLRDGWPYTLTTQVHIASAQG